jgi:hypothetical protein
MNEEQRAAFLISQSVCAMIEAMGMQAENMQREREEYLMAFGSLSFNSLIEKYGLGHNAAITTLRGQ